jgi:hypothetical protein
MGKPLVRFCEGPGINEGQEVRGTRHVVVACDEAFHESLVEHLISDHLKTSVYSKVLQVTHKATATLNAPLEYWKSYHQRS